MSCVLLAHLDGATSETAEIGGIFTFAGTAQLDTAQYKFGVSSLLLDGNSGYITLPDSADWNLGSGDFTLDLWARWATAADWGAYSGQFSSLGWVKVKVSVA
jgi:hypothetical protein